MDRLLRPAPARAIVEYRLPPWHVQGGPIKIHSTRCTRILSLVLISMVTACSSQQAAPGPTGTPQPTTVPSRTAQSPTSGAEIIFHNGNLITMEADQPLAQAIAIRDGLILAVGSNAEILALQDANTTLVDLQGRTLLPGFIDGHSHILTFPARKGCTLAQAQQTALSYGFTGVSEMWSNEDTLNSLLQAETNGELRLRVNVFASYNDGILDDSRQKIMLNTWYPAQAPILDPARMLRIPGIKIFVDGDNSQPARGCWAMSDPFEPGAGVLKRGICATTSGDLYWQQAELNNAVKQAQEAGYRVAFHAMGDRAIETALNAIEYALDGESNDLHRHQIAHNSMIRPDLLPRYQQMGILASVRGYAEICNLDDFAPTFGDRKAWYVNRFKLAGMGVHAFIETDFGWTVEPDDRYSQRTLDPLMHLYGTITRRYSSAPGSLCEPDPRASGVTVSAEQALRMLTIEPAYAVSMEDVLGSLKAGKYADLIILSGDPLTVEVNAILDMKVLMTMVGGKVEYCTAGEEVFCPQPTGRKNNGG